MLILGIDPATKTGWAIYDGSRGVVESGVELRGGWHYRCPVCHAAFTQVQSIGLEPTDYSVGRVSMRW